jgi:ATP-dependent Lhr-like helicase
VEASSAFDRLAPFVREFVYRQGWDELRPLQVQAIEALLDGQDDVLITTGTASGKTEAAFLPILSLIAGHAQGSVRVLYVGPLKALINDQFRRLELLCEQGNIPIHRWHGDVSSEHKTELVDHPSGVLQITPESIESLLINKTKSLPRLFSGLRFIVVDEVHSFLESDRGLQLQSQLERLSAYARQRPRRVGLSATVGDVESAKRWLNPEAPQHVRLIDPPVEMPPVLLSHMHFSMANAELPAELLDDLFALTKNRRSLIFCNSRRTVELVTNELNRRCRRERIEERYLPHHGSVSKEIREDAEAKMRDEERPHSVVCTTTLELGIDIGQLELAVQIDSTHSVMSFVQRLGRTGRTRGAPRVMQVYTSELSPTEDAPFYERLPFSMVKALAVVDLFLEGWVEPPSEHRLPYHVLYHQMLSRLIETNGSMPEDLVGFLHSVGVFREVPAEDYDLLLRSLASIDHVEQLDSGELILGLAGEKVARSRDFYAVFETLPEWDVLAGQNNIGRVNPSPDLYPGVCLLLSGRLWQVTDLLPDQKQVLVKPTSEAHDVLFEGSGVPDMHPRIAERARQIFERDDLPSYLSRPGQERLTEARRLYREVGLGRTRVLEGDESWLIFPWTGTRIARTLQFFIRHSGLDAQYPGMTFPWLLEVKKDAEVKTWDALTAHLSAAMSRVPSPEALTSGMPAAMLQMHKFDGYVPIELLRKRAALDWLDWPGATALLLHLLNDKQAVGVQPALPAGAPR